jgi:hypothetical protein
MVPGDYYWQFCDSVTYQLFLRLKKYTNIPLIVINHLDEETTS